jgi:hypothetical protein
MRPSRADEDLSASFVSDDKQRRLEFDHKLAGYVRGHCERWDITAVLEPLQLLGAKTGQVQVHLHRSPLGSLAVTIQFELQPAACDRRGGWRASSAAVTG